MTNDEIALYQACKHAGVPGYMHEGVVEYVLRRRPNGSFLTAVFANDFVGAVSHADSVNIARLREWALLMYNDIPQPCRGSYLAVKLWLNPPPPPPAEPTLEDLSDGS